MSNINEIQRPMNSKDYTWVEQLAMREAAEWISDDLKTPPVNEGGSYS
jgi:hypothetical protein